MLEKSRERVSTYELEKRKTNFKNCKPSTTAMKISRPIFRLVVLVYRARERKSANPDDARAHEGKHARTDEWMGGRTEKRITDTRAGEWMDKTTKTTYC